MKTPWGNADELRARRLRPGPANERELVAVNQRERLFAATVAAVTEHGYEAMRVEDLVAMSGVSRSAFYKYFANKEECFLATLDAILAAGEETVAEAWHAEDAWDARLRAAFHTLVEAVIDQPAAAQMCIVEAYAAGPDAVERLDAAVARIEAHVKRALGQSPERAGMPADVVRAIVGGIHRTVHTRLRRGEERALRELAPELLDWALDYRAPAEPLRRARVRPARPAPTPTGDEDAVERLLAAVTATTAIRGYAATTVMELATAGRASLTTFYANFDTKEDAFVAAIERAHELVIGAARAACDEAADWREGVREGFDAAFGVLAADPGLARIGALEAEAAGPRALDSRDAALLDLQALIEARVKPRSRRSQLTSEATAGAVLSLVYEQVRRRRAERMRELTPAAAFITLSPLVGGDEAYAVATAPRG